MLHLQKKNTKYYVTCVSSKNKLPHLKGNEKYSILSRLALAERKSSKWWILNAAIMLIIFDKGWRLIYENVSTKVLSDTASVILAAVIIRI